jgi:hypothetical protein
LKFGSNLEEAGQRICATEVKPNGFESLVQAADDVDDEGPVGDGFAEVAKILSLALVESAVVSDGELSSAGTEVGVGVQGLRCLIAKELRLDGEPDVAGGGTVLGDGVGKVVGDGAEEPSPHDAVHSDPIGGDRGGGIRQDVVLQGVPSECEEEGFA